jgi:hypothetical protein
MSGIGGGAVGAAVLGVLALGAAPANAPGAVVRPTESSFGSVFGHAITEVVDRDRPVPPRGQTHRGTLPAAQGLRRTLAP